MINEYCASPGTPADSEACGRICYEPLKAIGTAHNFPSDFPSPEMASDVLSALLGLQAKRQFLPVAQMVGFGLKRSKVP